jgi:hypothetical protein
LGQKVKLLLLLLLLSFDILGPVSNWNFRS